MNTDVIETVKLLATKYGFDATEANTYLFSKTEKKLNMNSSMNAESIQTFFHGNGCARSENGAVNDIREKALCLMMNNTIPPEFLESEFGDNWLKVQRELYEALKITAENPATFQLKAGRNNTYDFDMIYSLTNKKVKVEFKYGTKNMDDCPQILSLPTGSSKLIPETYARFFYVNYLDRMIACDDGITETKPSMDVYLKTVKNNKTAVAFFTQLKERDPFFKHEKTTVVNQSITEYLEVYGKDIDVKNFYERIKTSQNKIYLCRKNDQFYIDQFVESEMTNMVFHGIKNGNVIVIQSEHTRYNLLLRWRNRKGILNPAWQISLKKD